MDPHKIRFKVSKNYFSNTYFSIIFLKINFIGHQLIHASMAAHRYLFSSVAAHRHPPSGSLDSHLYKVISCPPQIDPFFSHF